jgi:hypothetical protein
MKFLNVKRPRLFVETRFIASENSRNKQLLSNEAPSRLDAINRVSTKAEKSAYPRSHAACGDGCPGCPEMKYAGDHTTSPSLI